MRVSFERVDTFDEILADADFQALRALFVADDRVRRFVPPVVKTFWRDVTAEKLWRYAAFWPHGDAALAQAIQAPTELLVRLYDTFGDNEGRLGRLRGAIIEGLVLAQLEPRYGANVLVDNAEISIEDDAGRRYTSPTTIDVSGWDGNVGECHDCKTRTKRIDLGLIVDLEAGLPDPEFRIGLVTADSRLVMAKALGDAGYAPGPRTHLIPLEEIATLAPLNRPRG